VITGGAPVSEKVPRRVGERADDDPQSHPPPRRRSRARYWAGRQSMAPGAGIDTWRPGPGPMERVTERIG